MAAPKGNKYWTMRNKDGRDPIFAAPEDLLKVCLKYFEWVEKHPLKSEEVFNTKEGIVRVSVSKMRAMTLKGLRVFLGGLSETAWLSYCKKEGFSWVTTYVRDVIDTQKFEGASANLLNANIIARDLGLADKKDHSSTDGSMTPRSEVKYEVVVVRPGDIKPEEPDGN